MILLHPEVLGALAAERYGLCGHCYARAWGLHMTEDNGNPRGVLRHPATGLRLLLWRVWILQRFDTGRPWWRDLLLNVGAAGQYVRVVRTNATAAARTA